MRILLDTHYLVWLVTDRGRLTQSERQLLAGDDHEVLISAISIWELRIKSQAVARRGSPEPSLSPRDAIAAMAAAGFRIHRPQVTDYAAPLHPPLDHKDPFDEILLVHAQQLGAWFMTRDRLLRDHPLALRV